MIQIPCYEPAGRSLNWSPEELGRHVIGIGSTGSGKTTSLMNPILQRSIAWEARNLNQKLGLLVLDPKEDGTDQKVRDYAREAGRIDDVLILSATSNSHYGFFSNCRRLEQVDEYTRRVLYGSRDMGEQNAYWTETRYGLLNSALTVLLANESALSFHVVSEFLRQWVFEPDAQAIDSGLKFVERLIGLDSLQQSTRRRLQLGLADAKNWRMLDARTRELHKSAISNALRPLFSSTARDLFDESRGPRFDPADVLAGKILVASLNATMHPGLAATLFKVLKRDYYQAVLSRPAFNPDRQRMCGLIMDELPLAVTQDDTDALALLRSKGGYVVACTQGLSSLDEAIGNRRRAALMANFNSVIYFASREDQTDEHAFFTLGPRKQMDRPDPTNRAGSLQMLDSAAEPPPVPICPPGALARLSPHQVYAKLADGSVTQEPHWLVPRFHTFTPEPAAPKRDDLAEGVSALKMLDAPRADGTADSSIFLVHMHRQKHHLKLTPNVVAATWQLCRPRIHPNAILSKLEGVVKGVDGLPPCWLVGFYRWRKQNPLLAANVVKLIVLRGMLWPELDAVSQNWGDGPMMIPEALNCFIYPSLWRPLQERHFKRLIVDRPDIRDELLALPQVEDRCF